MKAAVFGSLQLQLETQADEGITKEIEALRSRDQAREIGQQVLGLDANTEERRDVEIESYPSAVFHLRRKRDPS